MAEGGELASHAREDTTCFRGRRSALVCFTFHWIGGRRSVSIHIPLPVPAGFKPAARACALHRPGLAESCEHDSHTREDALGLANQPERPLG